MKSARHSLGRGAAPLAAILALCCVASCKKSVPPPPATLFVKGTVVAAVGSLDATGASASQQQSIELPNASVFLVPPSDPTHPVASTSSDLSGRFILKTTKRGVFCLRIEAPGFGTATKSCSGPQFRLQTADFDARNIAVRPTPDRASASLFGTVRLRDGRMARGFYPMLGLNAFSTVEMRIGAGNMYSAFVNNFGQYVVPHVPVRDRFTMKFSIDGEVKEHDVDPLSALVPEHSYELSAIYNNSAPRIRALTAMANGKPVQIAAPGSQVTLHAIADDPDGDALEYRWVLPDGAPPVGPVTSPDLNWTVPNLRHRFSITVVVSDKRGGYASNGITIDAASQRATFSGTVVDPDGAAIEAAQVEVNGRLVNTDSVGHFALEAPIADRYVMNIRKPGFSTPASAFGTASYIYRASVPAGRWTLHRAQVTTVDPTRPIVLEQRRNEKDCVGTLTSRMDWSGYLQPGLFDWQDGRGNSRALVDLGQANPKGVQNVMRLLSRVNPVLVPYLSKLTATRAVVDDRHLTCGPGIRVEIPANSLVQSGTNIAPTGSVQISLSTIALTTGDQMPGDYTVVGPSGTSAMESFGAGSIEIGNGTQRFNLKTGATATVTIPVDTTQLAGGAAPPSRIPILFYDEQAGVWHPDNQAVLMGSGTSAAAYTAKVKHFSTINSDIFKSTPSCVAVEVDSSLSSLMPFHVEVVMQPSQVNPGVIQVRQDLAVNTLRTNAIYNLPNNADIVLTPIVSGTLPDGSTGNVPAGVFVVNTGGPQAGGAGAPVPNADGSYYAENNGVPTGPCGSRVTLKKLNPPVLTSPDEFLQGLSFQSSNLKEVAASSATVAQAIRSGATRYFQLADPRNLRASFNLFKQKNRFGQPLAANEVEQDAQYANSGDLGFGRDMHCRRNVSSDGAFDYACYVTNFGQPPLFLPDQQDADDTADPTKADATVAMEFSRVENAANVFPDNTRAVKFYVYNTKNPTSTTRILEADLDGHGNRPVPQLCMVCHGGNLASVAADPLNPLGPKAGAFTARTDITSMRANFLPFDLHLYHFPATKSKAAQQAAFKTLNTEIVRGVSAATGTGAAIVEVIDKAFYAGGSATQNEDQVIAGWDPTNSNSNPHKLYQNLFARTCRTCHSSQPFGAPPFVQQIDFDNRIGSVQDKVCIRKIMPHAQRTNDVFWTSLNPNMPAFLELYGQTVLGWAGAGSAQCGLFFQNGTTVVSRFQGKILPILQSKCVSCHANPGLANFGVSLPPATVYNQLLNTLAKDGTSHYIVANNSGSSKLFIRISGITQGTRMPQNASPLDTTDTDMDGTNDQQEILNWINAGAPGP